MRLIIIPTYNEAQNIEALIYKILSIDQSASVLVVDDNSPDGTAEIVKRIMKGDIRVSLLSRQKKQGLGKAYIHAFSEILKDVQISEIAMMDADFSHNPDYLPEMFNLLSNCDAVIGSRYVRGGGIEGWELWRRILSYFGNVYCKTILRLPVYDLTSGFYCIKTEMLHKLELSSFDASGYAFQIELKYLLYKKGARFKEFPIIFANRLGGESKISSHIISEGVLAPWRMLFKK
ncbi:MAG: polyprenol monophosphomannose synthase [Candidatus Taylorbacteria bacterium]|nr:polyprenol monophosphomannose synthase [Candidatus Taylorbacteria bacterium]